MATISILLLKHSRKVAQSEQCATTFLTNVQTSAHAIILVNRRVDCSAWNIAKWYKGTHLSGGIMKLSEKIVQEYVRLNQGTSGYNYKQGLEDMEKLNLMNITKNDVEEIIKPFLYEWGGMRRVLDRGEHLTWEEDLAAQIHEVSNELQGFKQQYLRKVNLAKHESDIKRCYGSFKEAVGRVAAAKVLHFVCPNFFPPWDTKIAEAAKGERNQKVKEYSAEDYYMFMQQVQTFIKKRSIIPKLANHYKKSEVKIADECLWMATQRPFYLFF